MTDDSQNPYRCFPLDREDDGRQLSPSSERNGPHILKILKSILPKSGTVLEVAAGAGVHTVTFAPEFPKLQWLPSDPAADKLESIRAWMKAKPSPNILPPVALDTCDKDWPLGKLDAPVTAILCINMIHIAPWRAAVGLLEGAGRTLSKDGVLYLYGPYNVDGKFTSESNEAFDETLRKTHPEWGLRDVRDVEREAKKNGLALAQVIGMPANNKSLVFRKG